ncbi:unnamed protein product [Symbiodinium sp. KB8]|nr:unnamed protein product [Symbiodinium sp. KB8]
MLGSEEILPSASQSSEKEEALRAMTDGLGRGERPAKRQRLADGISAADAGSREWAEVISVIQPAIVALKVTFVVSFEDEHAAVAMGTGFVVDKQRGLILTNRHITGVGPVRAIAMFDRHEELDAEVIYRDPVHDFGFFRYDPSKLRLTEPAEIRLAPQELQVGTEVRIVGNDAGEKLQILSGTIARVDRNVPEINAVYCDENTFYAGAGAGTSGGSSGSPVLNKQGNAIALNAAGTDGAASAFFLPLSRVKVALQRLQDGLPVMRGTCQATFLFKAFDELRRIGLLEEHEQDVRKQVVAATGMLVVDSVLWEQKQLRPGDILLLLENRHCVDFVHLEEVLDDKVGCAVDVLVCRGGVEIAMSIDVHDLHSLIPRSYVELGMDVVHGLGYHAARRSHLPLDSGIYLARSGYVFESLGCDWGSLITSVNGKPTPSPEAFAKAIEHIPDKQYFPVHWYDLRDFRRDRALKTGFAKMSRAWSPLKLWRCASPASASPEQWTSEELPVPSRPPRRPEPLGRAAILTGGDRLVRALQTSLVTVRFRTDQRFLTEALDSGSSEGVGLLVDAKRGIVLTDRHSAPQSLGAIEVTLAGCATVEAEVFFIHPQHNIALLRCDPIAVETLIKGKLPLKSARFAKGKKASLRPGESVHFVGFDSQGNAFSAKCQVSAVYLPSGKDEFPPWTVPRFRERSLEAGWWLSFAFPTSVLRNALVMCGSSLDEVACVRLPMLSNTSVQVTVHYATSGTEIATFELEPTQSAQDIQQEIFRITGAPAYRQRLLCESEVLDPRRRLQDLGFAKEVNLNLIVQDLSLVATTSVDGGVKIWNAETGDCIQTLGKTLGNGQYQGVRHVEFSADGCTLLTAARDCEARIWNILTGESVEVLRGHTNAVYTAIFSDDGFLVLTASYDHTARLWSVLTGECLKTFTGHSDGVVTAKFSQDGQHVLTASVDRSAKVWDLQTAECMKTLQRPRGEVVVSVFSTAQRNLALSTLQDGTAKCWNLATDECLFSLKGHRTYITSAILSRDGLTLLTGSWDRSAKLWNLQASKKKCVRTFSGHSNGVVSAEFSADKSQIITAASDGTARIWNASNAEPLRTLKGHGAVINHAIVVLSDTPEDARGGVLCDSRGEVRALFASFDFQSARREAEETTDNFGIPASVFLPLLEGIKKNPNKEPEVRSLDIEVSAVDLATLARGSPKLPKPWAEAVRKRCGQQGQVARAICVCRVLSTGVSNGLLLPGDVLLSVAGRTITQALDVEEALIPKKDRPSSRKRERSEEVLIAFLRDGKEATVAVKPSILGSEDDADLVIWAGMVLRKTPRCILERCGASIAPRAGGVFVQSILNGSPAESREFAPYCFLMEMDGQPIRQLSDVLLHGQLDRNGPAHGWVRLLLLDMNGQEQVRAVQRDPLFFPTMTLHRSPQCWRCTQKG